MVDTRVGWDYSATGPLAGVWLILGLGGITVQPVP